MKFYWQDFFIWFSFLRASSALSQTEWRVSTREEKAVFLLWSSAETWEVCVHHLMPPPTPTTPDLEGASICRECLLSSGTTIRDLHLYSILTWKALELCLNLGVFLGRKNHLRAELSHSLGSFQYKLCFQESHTAKLLYIRSGNVQEPGSKSPTSGKEQRTVLALTYLFCQEHVAFGCWSIQPIQMKPKGKGRRSQRAGEEGRARLCDLFKIWSS